jgi:hypothetical protein
MQPRILTGPDAAAYLGISPATFSKWVAQGTLPPPLRSLIMSPRLKIAESRGSDIIKTVFNTLLKTEDGRRLLPEDWRRVYFGRDGDAWRYRTVCDFIASMTDRYCVEFYSRLVGIDAPSIAFVPF